MGNPPPENAAATGRKLRALVIEDNRDLAELTAKLFSILEVETWTAPDGQSGVTLACDISPDVILCDLHLPGMDGMETARALRSRLTGDPLLALVTADTITPEEEQDYKPEFDLVVSKPLLPPAFRKIVQAAEEKRRNRRG